MFGNSTPKKVKKGKIIFTENRIPWTYKAEILYKYSVLQMVKDWHNIFFRTPKDF